MKRAMVSVLALAAVGACAGGVTDGGPRPAPGVPSIMAARTDQAVIDRFAPKPSRGARIDYEVVDEALQTIVFDGGPSRRERAGRPDAYVGTRLVRGHDSPYRLEGNKIFFSVFDDETKRAISEYRAGLEAIAQSTDITTLSRNEQLAYWLNLHNMVVIDEITRRYPVQRPGRMRPSGGEALLHDAKIIDLGRAGRLSLRDVRGIVYAHWSDPDVLYGFFRGDIGSPRIRSEVYTGEGLRGQLTSQAREFVNALRGVEVRGDTLYPSAVYAEAMPGLLADEAALRAHLSKHADGKLRIAISETSDLAWGQYDETVADLAGGDVMSNLNVNENFNPLRNNPAAARPDHDGRAVDWNGRIPPQIGRLVQEYEEKIQRLRQDGTLAPRVTIEDIDTDDPDESTEID